MTGTQNRSTAATTDGAATQVVAPIRCLIVDDHPAVRAGLRALLDDDPRFVVIDAVATAQAAVSLAERVLFDVAIVDYQLGGRSGLWASRALKRLAHAPAVLVYSAYSDGPLAAACVVSHADGLIGKQRVDIELCDAICDVAVGKSRLPALPPAVAAGLEQRLDDEERMIFGMLRTGIQRAQVAQTIRCSEVELESKLSAMLRKLELIDAVR